jgi:hypothetical protein
MGWLGIVERMKRWIVLVATHPEQSSNTDLGVRHTEKQKVKLPKLSTVGKA